MSVASVVRRRLLVNYRVAPDLAARLLPAPLRPQVVNGWAVAGICLIRLERLRLSFVPAPFGVGTENAAHRVAVAWDTPAGPATGVYIPRRDSGSLITTAVGGRLFPGAHHRARFRVRRSDGDLRVAFDSADGLAVDVHVRECDRLPRSALFEDLDAASAFFRKDCDGYSTARHAGRLDGLRLRAAEWRVEPVEVVHARSSFFDDPLRFPAGSAVLDGALLMRDVPARWVPLPPMPVGTAAAASTGPGIR